MSESAQIKTWGDKLARLNPHGKITRTPAGYQWEIKTGGGWHVAACWTGEPEFRAVYQTLCFPSKRPTP